MLRRGPLFFSSRSVYPRGVVRANVALTTAAFAHSGSIKSSRNYNSSHNKDCGNFFPRHFLFGQSVLLFGVYCTTAFADDGSLAESVPESNGEVNFTGLQRVDDGSIISNSHTAKWRIFTDNGRDLSMKGKLDEAERYFILALEEAKAGFGERDAHVASSGNNLAEIYRVQKEYEKAEPLYLDSIKILEESFGPEDIRVGAAVHNLGQFYIVQHKLEEAQRCYERALKIKGRVLGYVHTDYADTMYHLGTVLHLRGKEKDAETLIRESISILEENGLGESVICMRRMKYLCQVAMSWVLFFHSPHDSMSVLPLTPVQEGPMYLVEVFFTSGSLPVRVELPIKLWDELQNCFPDVIMKWETVKMLAVGVPFPAIYFSGLRNHIYFLPMKEPKAYLILLRSNQLDEVENLQRKILHTLELSKGWNSLDTIKAAESLALTLQSVDNLMEAQEILERCLISTKKILGDNHIQVAANLLHLGRNAIICSDHLRKVNQTRCTTELDKAKVLLEHSLRIARSSLYDKQSMREVADYNDSRVSNRVQHFAIIILLRSLDAVGLWVTKMFESKLKLDTKEEDAFVLECEHALHESISLFKQPWTRKLLDLPDVKAEYLLCLKHLMSIVDDIGSDGKLYRGAVKPKSFKADIQQIEAALAVSTTDRC